ncbi:MAG: serine/threonine protein kinase, partial [Deltaproteobacteria bacterium]|nr:serine/threonine protein kinase [Deltaproteobacteria bacterium]
MPGKARSARGGEWQARLVVLRQNLVRHQRARPGHTRSFFSTHRPIDDNLGRVSFGGACVEPSSDLLCHRCGYRPRRAGTETVCAHDGLWLVAASEHEKAPRDPFLGSTLGGKYVVIGLLGAGGMGSVYRAIQQPVQREVAVKTILPAQEERQEARARFEREAQVVARLTHPHTVRLFDYGVEQDGTLFMVQELVQGRTLTQLLRSGKPFEPRRLARLSQQVLGSLAEAHSLGLVHRDLKPDNLMLVQTSWGEEHVKVLDFGIVKIVSGEEGGTDQLTRTGMIFGTPQYMSPEQAMGAPLDGRSDIYSLGVVMHHLLTGHPPFESTSVMALLLQQVQEPPPALPLNVPPALAGVILRALQKRPEDRFPDAVSMAQAIQYTVDLAPQATLSQRELPTVALGEQPAAAPGASGSPPALPPLPPLSSRSLPPWPQSGEPSAVVPQAVLPGAPTVVQQRQRGPWGGLLLGVGLTLLLLAAGGLAVWMLLDRTSSPPRQTAASAAPEAPVPRVATSTAERPQPAPALEPAAAPPSPEAESVATSP